ncbi:CocE/NonD family hydrolase [Paracidobacterium acidisoli]|uniref:CocE/NonD family hydrolase n=1 Tax=Paracidobacterium acidisoli TaxID=2303751 RepID=A0A372IMQ8_9BACT|nr:CocE/NonD family hydrolase [Paracidobacterium acidisoli]MBT9331634.1 CocE/NonD family hydrolase [Paracidobacterium acidisoli]
MPLPNRIRPIRLFVVLLTGVLTAAASAQTTEHPKYPNYPSETPANFQPPADGFNYTRRDVMIPMRDGVKLHTVILIPNGAKDEPILLTRTPYDATALTSYGPSSHLASSLDGYDNATDIIVDDGYIRVVQDIRGKYGSEGDYIMNRPIHGPQNPTPVDESTDTYDTIDWLVKNIPESNGKVGILGISYDGFLPLMALINPHPALKVAVPMNPMVDGWMGDDWFHNGAFREQNMPYIYEQDGTRSNTKLWWTSDYDDYDMFMKAGSAGELGKERGLDQLGFWRKIIEHPSYDAFWSDQAVDKVLANEPLKVPTLLVDSLWDQEDIYGAMAVYKAIKPKDTQNDMVYLAIGPWHHGQEIEDASSLGPIRFGSDTGLFFRQHILRPFLAHYLKNNVPQSQLSPVWAFETGRNHWEKLPAWPEGCAKNCPVQPTPLYLEPGLKAGFTEPAAGAAQYDEYISDPSKPVPFRARPIQPIGYTGRLTWARWLVDDQREASGRPDVLTYESEVLTEPIKISGQPVAHLIASTTGTDSDWVVKLIDVYPDEVAGEPELGGYQLMISADIFRGRYRESFAKPEAITPNDPLEYKFEIPTANHVFLPGHRIMVQVQSSWFPLYDRNPQTFVPNIFLAKPQDYQRATQRVWHTPGHESLIELPVVKAE